MELSQENMAKENRRDFWLEKTKAWEKSLFTQQEFCHQHNLNYSTFVYWRMKFLDGKRPSSSPKLAPVKVVATPTSASPPSIRIKLPNGTIIELPIDLPESNLKTVIKSLGVVSC